MISVDSGYNGGPLIQRCLRRVAQGATAEVLPILAVLLTIALRHRPLWLKSVDSSCLEAWLRNFVVHHSPSSDVLLWEYWRLCLRLNVSEELRHDVRGALSLRLKVRSPFLR